MRVWQFALATIAAAVTGCQGASQPGTSASTVQTPTTGSVVVGRAAQPTQTNATGITISGGSFNFSIYNRRIEISARDWNTITDTSVVPHDIGVSIDPNIHPSETTRNRLQYLADRMFPFIETSFLTIGIVSVAHGASNIVVAAFINPTDNTYRMNDLKVSVVVEPPLTTISSATFYSTPATNVIIPGRNIYFAWLPAPLVTKPPPTATTKTYNFNYNGPHNCGQAPCPQPSA